MSFKLDEILKIAKAFDADFINMNGEIILDYKTNTYAVINDCKTLEEVNMRMVFALARPIYKSLSEAKSKKFLNALNRYFNTNLTRDDMGYIYRDLCYNHKQQEFTEFIKRGFPVEELKMKEVL